MEAAAAVTGLYWYIARSSASSRRLSISFLYETSLFIYLTTYISLPDNMTMNHDLIQSISCIPMRLPFHHWADPPLFAGRPRTTLDSALVRLETQDGTVAWGESYCVEPQALVAIFKSL